MENNKEPEKWKGRWTQEFNKRNNLIVESISRRLQQQVSSSLSSPDSKLSEENVFS